MTLSPNQASDATSDRPPEWPWFVFYALCAMVLHTELSATYEGLLATKLLLQDEP